MQIKLIAPSLLFVLLMATSPSAHAQASAPARHAEQRPQTLELTYDYIHSNGPPHGCGCFSFNGGGAAYTHQLAATKMDFVARFGAGRAGGISASNLGATLTTYTAGLRYYPKWKSARWQPYGEFQAGGAYGIGSLFDGPNPSGSTSHGAFAGSVGAGMNLRVRPRFSIKLVDVQYLATTFANGDNHHQNNLRVSTGVVLRFGK